MGEWRLGQWFLIRKALIPAEMPAVFATDEAGGNRGELTGQVGIPKPPAGEAQVFQTAQHGPKTLFGLDAKEDEMRRLVTGRNERACRVDRCQF